jgi:8-oxo-dGTP pyrophosphatase MutT (NUDIX family)
VVLTGAPGGGMSAPVSEVLAASASIDRLEPWLRHRLRPLDLGSAVDCRVSQDVDADGAPMTPYEGDLVPAAVLVSLVAREEGVCVIFTRRADTLARHSGQIALPGGRIELGETPWAAAVREAHEEIGLEPCFVRPLGLGDIYRTVTGFEITPVVAVVQPGFSLVPSAAEVAEVFETPFAFLMDPANHELRVLDGPAGRRRYYVMPHRDRLIWGATAGILRALWERLFDGPAPVAGLADEA